MLKRLGDVKSSGELKLLTLPFGEDAADIANYVSLRLCKEWWQPLLESKTKEEIPDQPVVLPVNLAEVDTTHLSTLPSALAEAVNRRHNLDLSPDALRNATQLPSKLVLILFDRPSTETSCWTDERFESSQRLMAELSELPVKRHTVLAICSDLHHQRLWEESAGLREPPTERLAAAEK